MSQRLSSEAMPTLSLTLSTTTKGDQVILPLQPWKPRLREGQRPAQGHPGAGAESALHSPSWALCAQLLPGNQPVGTRTRSCWEQISRIQGKDRTS